MNSRGDGFLYQYAKNGTLLQTLNINGGGFNDNVHGMEFEMPPPCGNASVDAGE